MPLVQTKYFGCMQYQAESVFDFPFGLPGFEQENCFVIIESPDYAPVIFLQSLKQPGLCFLALPVHQIDPGYRLSLSAEDRAALGIDQQAEPSNRILTLALLSLLDGSSPTANLMAPIVINSENRRALQSIRFDQAYSHQHPVAKNQLSERVC